MNTRTEDTNTPDMGPAPATDIAGALRAIADSGAADAAAQRARYRELRELADSSMAARAGAAFRRLVTLVADDMLHRANATSAGAASIATIADRVQTALGLSDEDVYGVDDIDDLGDDDDAPTAWEAAAEAVAARAAAGGGDS